MTRKRKTKMNYLDIFVFVVSMIAIIVSIYTIYTVSMSQFFSEEVSTTLTLPELSTIGYVQITPEATVIGDTGVVVLTGGCYQVTASTEPTQAISIANGLVGKIDFRPNSHDLVKATFDSLGIEVLMVKITDLKNNTFFGKLILKQGSKIISLDSRPSDATAIAVRTKSPIYMKEKLMKELGEYIC